MFSGTDVRVRKVLVSNEMIRFLQNFAARCSVCGSSFKFCAFRLPQGGGGGRIPCFGRPERRDFSHRNGTASGCAHARFCGMPAAFHPRFLPFGPLRCLPDGRKLRITVTGKNTGAISMAFQPENETTVDSEITADTLDKDGTLVILDDELVATQSEADGG